MAGGDDDSSLLLSTPTWAIASTCAIFIFVSLIIERAIHRVGRHAGKYNRAALLRAFEKMKDELLMVGILSLALAMGQSIFAKVCVPAEWYKHGRLCEDPFIENTENKTITLRAAMHAKQRHLLAAATPSTCKEGHVAFMTTGNIHDLHILLFVLAVVHIVYTVMIIAIGTWVVGRWKAWEDGAIERSKQATSEGFARLTAETTFIRHRAGSKWLKSTPVAYVVAFFKLFFGRVSETDYISLRGGFIKRHFGENSHFNFHKYIQRSFQDDFKHVVGISTKLWVYAILWLLADVNGWEKHVLVALVPLLLVLVVGTKMQYILAQMANEIVQLHAVVIDFPHVEPNDSRFWFNKPKFMLKCLHFIVFQNALGTASAIWAAVTFPPQNCLYGNLSSLVMHIVIGVVVQVICGFFALPIYALVSQMGSYLKKTIFDEVVNSALRNWQVRAKRHANDGISHWVPVSPTSDQLKMRANNQQTVQIS